MNVTKELLENCGVVSTVLSAGAKDHVCFLNKTSGGIFFFSLLSPAEVKPGERILLRISFKSGSEIASGSGELSVSESGEDYITGTVENPDEALSALLKRFSALEYQDEKYGRRKEERLPVGKANFSLFGLATPEQTLFVRGIKLMQPCAIVDASLHGICIITPYSLSIKPVENFSIKISFRNPDETVILQAHKVHSKLNRTESKIFATISCQLLEPINYLWKSRVIKLSESMRGDPEPADSLFT